MKLAYYPGCVAQYSGKELDMSTRKVAQKLGIELVDFPNFSCCGAGVIDEVNLALNVALNARNLALCEEKGLEMLTVCSTCQGMMVRSNRIMQAGGDLAVKANAALAKLGMQYKGTTKIKHMLELLTVDYGLDKVKQKVVRPLKGLRASAFYGCHLLRPGDVLEYDDPVDPRSFEDLFGALGAEPVWYDGRIKCCGFPILFVKEDSANKMAGVNLKEAVQKGSDVMVTSCPLCHISLDAFQPNAEASVGDVLSLPTLHLPQIVGLALGIPPAELGLGRHIVSVDPLLEKLDLVVGVTL
jgi:succinate dehydrogenase / fumarate reductase cytochrome b subunit